MSKVNPWESPATDPRPWNNGPGDSICCPECGAGMSPGYLTTGAWLYWRKWSDRSLLVKFSDRLMNTLPSFVGTNRLPGYRCTECELVVFRYGKHRGEWNGEDQTPVSIDDTSATGPAPPESKSDH